MTHTKARNLFVTGLLLLAVLVIALEVLVFSGRQNQNQDETGMETSLMVDAPLANTLYVGIYQGKQATFYTNESAQTYYDDNGIAHTDTYLGYVHGAAGQISFAEMVNPEAVYESTEKFDVSNLVFNAEGTKLYVGIITESAATGFSFKIAQIDLFNHEARELWTSSMREPKYEDRRGAAYPDRVIDDKYLTFRMGTCYACDGGVGSMVILNIATLKEKYISDSIGNLQFDLPKGKFTYQKLSANCANNACEGVPPNAVPLEPSGKTYTETLP